MEKYKQPDFNQIYSDIITKKYPHKYKMCENLLVKKDLPALDILKLNSLIFGTSEKNSQKYRSFKKTDILKMLDYQKKNNLNNTQLALHFKLSRNTVGKWRKIFLV